MTKAELIRKELDYIKILWPLADKEKIINNCITIIENLSDFPINWPYKMPKTITRAYVLWLIGRLNWYVMKYWEKYWYNI